ncbi:major facilitator superfamily domain-containing protein [Xylariales sp. AK1849]|nr:major facilitator superfamily domain-containing protein [Xylariales sp. AK1849]
MDVQSPDETTRLLPPQDTKPRPGVIRTILSTAVAILTLNIGSHIAMVPTVAILEMIVCRRFYESSLVWAADERCKAEAVQSEVAYINGWKDAFEMLPAILLAVPYGSLADRIGRKKVLLLVVLGCFLNDVWIRLVFWLPGFFPMRTVWLGEVGQVVGAGAGTLTSLSFVLVADVCSPDQRTIAFSYITSAMVLSQFVFLPVGGALVSVNPWIPMLASCGFTVAGFLLIAIFVPETLASSVGIRSDRTKPTAIKEYLKSSLELGRMMTKNVGLVLVSSCFFLYHFGEQAGGSLLLQYISERLRWSLSRTSFLLALGAGMHLLVLLFLLPAFSSILLRYSGFQGMGKDMHLTQISAIFLVVGSGMIFFATALPTMVAGQIISSLG